MEPTSSSRHFALRLLTDLKFLHLTQNNQPCRSFNTRSETPWLNDAPVETHHFNPDLSAVSPRLQFLSTPDISYSVRAQPSLPSPDKAVHPPTTQSPTPPAGAMASAGVAVGAAVGVGASARRRLLRSVMGRFNGRPRRPEVSRRKHFHFHGGRAPCHGLDRPALTRSSRAAGAAEPGHRVGHRPGNDRRPGGGGGGDLAALSPPRQEGAVS